MSANLMSLARSGGKFLKLFGDRKMMKPLPYDAEVEYLESTGTQYVETGVIPDRNSKISVTTAVTSTTEQFMGAINKEANRFHFSFYSGGFFRGCVGINQTEGIKKYVFRLFDFVDCI